MVLGFSFLLPDFEHPSLNLDHIFCVCWSLSRVQLFATPWTVPPQAPLSMGFSRQEDWSGLPFPPPGDLPDPGMEPTSPELQRGSLVSHQGKPLGFIQMSAGR